MKTTARLFLTFLILGIIQDVIAQDIIKLPEPDKQGGKPLMEVLNARSSSRDFIDKELTEKQMSDLLWAAFGVNRKESGKRTAPTSRNKRDIELYITSSKGTFIYLAEQHALKQIGNDDIRKVTGKQDFVKEAAINIIYVSDFDKLGNGSDDIKKITAATHCGFIGQNVYLYCASEGLISVFRAWINKEKIKEALNLKENQHVIYSQSVGCSK